jgi:hypothetical protein
MLLLRLVGTLAKGQNQFTSCIFVHAQQNVNYLSRFRVRMIFSHSKTSDIFIF